MSLRIVKIHVLNCYSFYFNQMAIKWEISNLSNEINTFHELLYNKSNIISIASSIILIDNIRILLINKSFVYFIGKYIKSFINIL